MTAKRPTSGGKGEEAAAARAQRSAEALRANLRRRKAQERGRAEPATEASNPVAPSQVDREPSDQS